MPRKALGMGLGLAALVPPSVSAKTELIHAQQSTHAEEARVISSPIEIEIAHIVPNRYQPRQTFDPSALDQLAQSIRRHGVIQPLLVCPIQNTAGVRFELIAGERRMRAATLAGLSKVPALVKELDRNGMMEYALIENLQREDLNPMDKAHAYSRLLSEFSCTQEEIAERVGVDRSSVTNTLRLLNLPHTLQKAVAEGTIRMGQAKILLGVEPASLQIRLAERIQSEGLSIRALTTLVQNSPKKRPVPAAKTRHDPEMATLERRFLHAFGTKVSVVPSRKGSGGEIKITYYSLDDLDRILETVEHK